MKKFSKITGEKVTEQSPIIEKKYTDLEIMKVGIMKLMDNYLGVQMYGPVNRYAVAGSTKVIGKELFLEALIDMMSEFSTKENIKLLENLKSKSTNWELLDTKIYELNNHLSEISESKLVGHKDKIRSLVKRYSDKNDLFEQIDISVKKISNPKTAELRSIAAKQLISEGSIPSSILETIFSKYSKRFIELAATSE